MEIFKMMRAVAAADNMPEWWLNLSAIEQTAYLTEHPTSHLKQTSFPVDKKDSTAAPVTSDSIVSDDPADTASNALVAAEGTPEMLALDTAVEAPAAQELVLSDANGTPMDPTDDEKQQIRGATFAAVMLLAVVSGALEETFPIKDYADKAADWLCVRAGYKPIYNADGDLSAQHEAKAQTSHKAEGFSADEVNALKNHSSSTASQDKAKLREFYVRFAAACLKHSMKKVS